MNITRVAVVLLVVVSVVGCASYDGTRETSMDFDPMAQNAKVVDNGIAIMARAYHDEEDLRKYLGEDLLAHGILPVKLYLRNQEKAVPVTYELTGVKLIDAEGTESRALTVSEAVDKAISELLKRESGWLIFNTHGLDEEGWGPIRATYLDALLMRLKKIPTVDVLPPLLAFSKYAAKRVKVRAFRL